jgi:hypothetical protein
MVLISGKLAAARVDRMAAGSRRFR